MTTEPQYDSSHPPKHCPECQKKGVKKKVKVYSINLENEGVYMCEDVTCPWPFNLKNVQQFDVPLKTNK